METSRGIRTIAQTYCPVCKSRAKYFFSKKQYHIYQCLDCKLGFLHPMPTWEEVRAVYTSSYYNSSESDYGYHVSYALLEKGLKRQYLTLLKAIKKIFPEIKPSSILDVGCAYGYFLDVAAQMWAPQKLVGTDLNPGVKQIIEQKGYSFICSPVEELTLNIDSLFDLIFLGDCFEHFYNPFKVMEEIRSLLSPKGIVVLTTVNFNSFLPLFFRQKWRLMTPPEHLFFWTPESIKILFSQYRLKVRCQKYWLFYPKIYVYHRFQDQFHFKPHFLKLFPFNIIPIYSFDTFLAIAWRHE